MTDEAPIYVSGFLSSRDISTIHETMNMYFFCFNPLLSQEELPLSTDVLLSANLMKTVCLSGPPVSLSRFQTKLYTADGRDILQITTTELWLMLFTENVLVEQISF